MGKGGEEELSQCLSFYLFSGGRNALSDRAALAPALAAAAAAEEEE